jgi:hypothetical protein
VESRDERPGAAWTRRLNGDLIASTRGDVNRRAETALTPRVMKTKVSFNSAALHRREGMRV